MLRIFIRISGALLVAFTISACTVESETDSENIKTSGIHAEISTVSSGDGNTGVSTRLTVGSGGVFSTNLNLTGGDTLSATDGVSTTVLQKDKDWYTGQIFYRAILAGDTADTQITVALTRPNDTDAPNSVVAIPYSPDIIVPSDGDTLTQGENITVTWDNTNSTLPINLDFDFYCTLSGGKFSSFDVTKANIANTPGSISYSIASLLGNLTLKSGESCTAKITISRQKSGTLDPNYGEGGSISAIQHRNVSVTIGP